MRFLTFDCSANREEEDTKKESAVLFKKAKNSINIVAGNVNSAFYNDSLIVDAIQSAVERGVNVRIAYDPHALQSRRVKSAVLKIPKVEVWKLKESPDRHIMIVDGKHVRIEQKHPNGAIRTPAIICRNAGLLARDKDLEFESLVKTK